MFGDGLDFAFDYDDETSWTKDAGHFFEEERVVFELMDGRWGVGWREDRGRNGDGEGDRARESK